MAADRSVTFDVMRVMALTMLVLLLAPSVSHAMTQGQLERQGVDGSWDVIAKLFAAHPGMSEVTADAGSCRLVSPRFGRCRAFASGDTGGWCTSTVEVRQSRAGRLWRELPDLVCYSGIAQYNGV